MTEPADSLPGLTQELRDLHRIFAENLRLLVAGQGIDLSGTDERVKEFCLRIEQANPAIRTTLLPEFSDLLGVLEALETELRRAQDRVKQEE